MTDLAPLLLPYDGIEPRFASAPVHTGPGSAILGRATLGRAAWIGAFAVIRADGHTVTIGDDFRIGARGTVHIAHEIFPAVIGSGVTVGTFSVVHACIVGDGCWIGDNVVVLDGSEVAPGCALGDGAIVFPGSRLDGGWLHEGMPAKPVRRLEPGELDRLHAATRAQADAETAPHEIPARLAGTLLVAATARIAGRVQAAGDNGVWFGCDLDAGSHEIAIGQGTNIQDNTLIRCEAAPVRIGRESTVGHNVTMTDCSVGDSSLIGIGAVVAPGTAVGDGVLLAAGARTEPGQVLDSGGFYTGSPARLRGPLDARKQAIIARTWPTYCDYARRFDAVQTEALAQTPTSGP